MSADPQPDSLETQVFGFVADQWRTKREKLSPSTRLAQDLGMEGDDAVEFFTEFGKRFGVDLDELHTRWGQHFSHEGSGTFTGIVVVVLCVSAGFWLHDTVGILPAWAWGISLIVTVTLVPFLVQRHRGRAMKIPITIADLIDAAQSGRWSKSYATDPPVRTRR